TATTAEQAQVRGHLIVARAARVELRARGSAELDEPRLDVHVDVFFDGIPAELAALDLPGDRVQAGHDGVRVRLLDHADARQPPRVRLGSGDVLPPQGGVDVHALVEPLHCQVDGCGQSPATPHAHCPCASLRVRRGY